MSGEEEEERSFIAAWALPGNSSEVITRKTPSLQEEQGDVMQCHQSGTRGGRDKLVSLTGLLGWQVISSRLQIKDGIYKERSLK